MSKSAIRKQLWLFDLIKRRGHISFIDISNEWQKSILNETGDVLPKRTFQTWKEALSNDFYVRIGCSRFRHEYFLENEMDIQKGRYSSWLINTLFTQSELASAVAISDRILLEEIPGGQPFLHVIIKALETNTKLSFSYHIYDHETSYNCILHPYCLKYFKQRWYVVGFSEDFQALRTYSLDRIVEIEPSGEKFEYPKDFNGELYFRDCVGIFQSSEDPIDVKLYARKRDANYLRSVPLHHSQTEEVFEDHSVFTLRVKPTFDFYQLILKQGPGVHVLEPESLREKVKGMLNDMISAYS